MPTKANFSLAMASASSSETPKFKGPNMTSLRTVSSKSWASGNWKTTPTCLRKGLREGNLAVDVTKTSPRRTEPLVGLIKTLRC